MLVLVTVVVMGIAVFAEPRPASVRPGLDVVAVDELGKPIPDVPFGATLRLSTTREVPYVEAAMTDPPAITAADGTVTLTIVMAEAINGTRAKPMACALVPMRSTPQVLEDDGAGPTTVRLGPVGFASLVVRDERGRSRVGVEGLRLAFDDGTREEHYDAARFARDGDHIVVPIAGAWNGRIHVRAGLGGTRSARVRIDQDSKLELVLAPAPRLVATLTSPAMTPVQDTAVDIVPIDPGAKLTCMFHDENPSARRPNDSRVTSATTDAQGVLSIAVPFDTRSPTESTNGLRQTQGNAVRIEVHHPYAACWIAQASLDANVESGTIDLGALRFVRDEWMICGRVVDDRGEPVAEAEMTHSESDAVTIGIGSRPLPTPRTDAHGRFRMRVRRSELFVPVRDGYVSPPSIRLDPGTSGHEIVLQRCARVEFRCNPSESVIPERFALRWRGDVATRIERLHSWNEVLERIAPGRLALEFTLDGIDTGLVPPEVELAPGSTTTYDLDLRECGLVTLRVVDTEQRTIGSARARLADSERTVSASANGIIRFAIPRRTASLTCQADGYAPATGVYAHGEHVVVLTRPR